MQLRHVALLFLLACRTQPLAPAESETQTSAAECPEAPPPPACDKALVPGGSIVSAAVSYTLSVAPPEGTALPSMSVVATVASGLELPADARVARDVMPSLTQLVLSQGSSDDRAALAAWAEQVRAFAAACTDAGLDCTAEWQKQKPQIERTGTLTMTTQDGVLATWTLAELWPLELAQAEQPTPEPIVVMALAATVTEVAVNEAHPLALGAGGLAVRWKAPELNSSSDARRGYLSPETLRSFVAARTLGPRDVATGQASGKSVQFSDDVQAPHFRVEIDGEIVGRFREVSGLESEVEIVEYKNGDDPHTHKRPGKTKFKNIVLKRGLVTDTLVDWSSGVLAGKPQRKSGSIVYLDRNGRGVRRLNLYGAEPGVTHVHGDPHVDQGHGGRWDFVTASFELSYEKAQLAR